VGGYIFLAGLSGASMLLAGIGDATRGKDARIMVRNGRYLSMLAPTIGSVLLVADLHTPQRFYNMLRIAKRTSPMSIGTWILMSFTGFAGISAGGELLSRVFPWMRFVARAGQVPAAVAGAGLSTYTATLLSATSTPAWAAIPRSLPVRFGASSVAAAASALALLEPAPAMRCRLEDVAALALATELAGTLVSERTYEKTGVAEAQKSRWGRVERIGVKGLGVLLPLGLYAASTIAGPRTGRALRNTASIAALAGSALLRVSMLGLGDESAVRPEVSFRFSQPENLPDPAERWSIREKIRRVTHAKNKR
jgi:formate-dependent nitrite reductase membrane component NrfD